VRRPSPNKCPKCGGALVVRGPEEEISCLQCGYVEYLPRAAGGNGSSGPAIAADIPAEKGNEATGAVDEWIHAGEQLLASLEEERDRRRKELTALEYQIRILRWRVHGRLARYWSPEKRAAQAERMRAMNKAKVRKGVSAAIVR
jgi:ribosomal protein S27AE